MQAIIIGAGRGRRLMPTTADTPKCFADVGGKRILDWTLDAFRQHDVSTIRFIGGYQIDKVRQEYPELSFCHNQNWENNNILASLFCAEQFMDEPFICCYSDVLFTPAVVGKLLDEPADMSLVVDTDWLIRYGERTHHPPDDAEKVIVEGPLVTRIHRDIDPASAHGEFIGVAKFSADGAARLKTYYHRCKKLYDGKQFREAVSFEKAYMILLFQEMIEAGETFVHVDTHGEYIEIDTQQDFDYARRHWK
jgi:choline kinase